MKKLLTLILLLTISFGLRSGEKLLFEGKTITGVDVFGNIDVEARKSEESCVRVYMNDTELSKYRIDLDEDGTLYIDHLTGYNGLDLDGERFKIVIFCDNLQNVELACTSTILIDPELLSHGIKFKLRYKSKLSVPGYIEAKADQLAKEGQSIKTEGVYYSEDQEKYFIK